MLVPTRNLNETIIIDGLIRVIVLGIKGNKVRIGVSAPEDIQVDREEIAQGRFSLGAPDKCIVGDRDLLNPNVMRDGMHDWVPWRGFVNYAK